MVEINKQKQGAWNKHGVINNKHPILDLVKKNWNKKKAQKETHPRLGGTLETEGVWTARQKWGKNEKSQKGDLGF